MTQLDQFFAEHGDVLVWVRPQGGMTAFPWLKSNDNSHAFCEAAAQHGVLLAPGDCFGAPAHFRLGFGASGDRFAAGLERLGGFVRHFYSHKTARRNETKMLPVEGNNGATVMDLLKRYYEEMWNTWNFDLASELLTDDFRFRGSFGVEIVGHEAFKDYMRLVQSAFPDFHNRIDRSLYSSNEVVAQLTYSGTHKGTFLGIPATGHRVTYPGIAIFNRKDGRFSEGYVVGDRVVLMEAILGPQFWHIQS